MSSWERWFKKERIFDTLQGYEDAKAGWDAAMSRSRKFAILIYGVTILALILALLVCIYDI